MGTILKQAVKYESGKFPYLDCQCGHRLSVNMGCPTTVCICGLIYDDGGYILNHDTVCRGCVTDGKEAHTCPEHAITTETLLKVRERILANLHRVSAKLAERMPRLPIVAGRPGIFEAYCLTIRRAYPEPDLLVAVAREPWHFAQRALQ